LFDRSIAAASSAILSAEKSIVIFGGHAKAFFKTRPMIFAIKPLRVACGAFGKVPSGRRVARGSLSSGAERTLSVIVLA
jgi:hypothetical protein